MSILLFRSSNILHQLKKKKKNDKEKPGTGEKRGNHQIN